MMYKYLAIPRQFAIENDVLFSIKGVSEDNIDTCRDLLDGNILIVYKGDKNPIFDGYEAMTREELYETYPHLIPKITEEIDDV